MTTPDRKKVIGVTGGPGCGKSEFAAELRRLGALLIDADQVARELIDASPAIQEGIRRQFGSGYFDETGRLKRRELGRLVFSDRQKLSRLMKMTNPPLVNSIREQIDQFRAASGRAVCVVDMAILFESRIELLFDCVVVVTASLANRMDRLREKRRWDDTEIQNRIRSQLDLSVKAGKADVVIQNDGSLEDLKRKAGLFFSRITGPD